MKKAIVPVYQPIIDAETGGILHYEALARVRNGEAEHGGLIEMGETVGFIDLIDIAMLEHVVEALQDNTRAIVAVNVSGVTIERSCNDLLAAIFKNMEFMRRVVFEITETSEIRDLRMLSRFLTSIRLLDARVALDDFGTGFCTIDFVEQIKPDFVKLDGEVVAYADETGDTEQIRRVRDLVDSFGGSIIAERIDTKRKVEVMKALDIRYLQGFYVGGILSSLPAKEPSVVPVKRLWQPLLSLVSAGG